MMNVWRLFVSLDRSSTPASGRDRYSEPSPHAGNSWQALRELRRPPVPPCSVIAEATAREREDGGGEAELAAVKRAFRKLARYSKSDSSRRRHKTLGSVWFVVEWCGVVH